MRSLQRFLPLGSMLGVIDTDSSSEFTKACEDLSRNHDKSTQYRSETNGYLRNIQDLLADGKTPNERRFGEHFAGHKLNIFPSQRKRKRGFINSARKSSKASLWDMRCMRELERDILVADAEEVQEGHAPEV